MSVQRITSRSNAALQHVKKLRADRAYRYAQGQFVADGVKLLAEALQWNADVRMVVAVDSLPLPPLPQTVRCLTVPEGLMRELSRMDTPQGVMLVCAMPEKQAPQPVPGCLILDGIQDPGNVGTILRTADALEVPVLLSEGCADPYNEKTVRASMGAVLRSAPVQATRAELLCACARNKLPVYAAALSERAQDLRALALQQAAVVIGSEGQGVSEDFLRAAQAEIIIPMSAHCESLNAAAAAAIIMWQMRG